MGVIPTPELLLSLTLASLCPDVFFPSPIYPTPFPVSPGSIILMTHFHIHLSESFGKKHSSDVQGP